uniref:Clathrin adaptor alpha/beta/gamma-adaptin appendage Ig-like subdomain domain-containing protein n=1 Tax=Acrobeloides nanus TaxID=290746 RepID=A0A914CJP2_9BILA
DVSAKLIDVDTTTSSTVNTNGTSNTNPLVDIFGSTQNGTNHTNDVAVQNAQDITKFLFKQSGVLYEDDVVQIGCKLETRTNLARLGMFYGNKTSAPFADFQATVSCPGALAAQLLSQAKPVDSVIQAGAQVQQLINFICVNVFEKPPVAHVTFNYVAKDGSRQAFSKSLYLPMFISKFFEPTDMTSEQFFNRWKQLSQPTQESQQIFPAAQPMDNEAVKTKLAGLGSKLLTDVDPNPENFVCAGIVHTQTQQIGTLVRLEPNKQAKMYRLTVRSSRDILAKHICELLSPQF